MGVVGALGRKDNLRFSLYHRHNTDESLMQEIVRDESEARNCVTSPSHSVFHVEICR